MLCIVRRNNHITQHPLATCWRPAGNLLATWRPEAWRPGNLLATYWRLLLATWRPRAQPRQVRLSRSTRCSPTAVASLQVEHAPRWPSRPICSTRCTRTSCRCVPRPDPACGEASRCPSPSPWRPPRTSRLTSRRSLCARGCSRAADSRCALARTGCFAELNGPACRSMGPS